MARVSRFTASVSCTSFWNPSFSSLVATRNTPPKAVPFLASKLYGVEALISLGSALTSPTPCLAGLLSLCSVLLITICVTAESQLARVPLRGSSVLHQDFRGPQVGFSIRRGDPAQTLCISQLSAGRYMGASA